MTEALSRCRAVYEGSDADATQALYSDLARLGPQGNFAVNLFRAQKASERAKSYSRRYTGAAYDKKQWSMQLLVEVLTLHDTVLDLAWGWGIDTAQAFHNVVLYIDLPTGQVSFHSASRGPGPEYPGAWDGAKRRSPARIVRYAAFVIDPLTSLIEDPHDPISLRLDREAKASQVVAKPMRRASDKYADVADLFARKGSAS